MNMSTFWIVVTVAAAVIEIFTAGNLICVWFCFGGAAGILLASLHTPEIIQYIAFFVVSIISMLIIRPLAYNYLRGNTVPTNSDRLIGQHTLLTQEITLTSWGATTIGGTHWSAASVDGQPIAKDTMVKIVAIEGSKLLVKEID